MQKAGGRRLGEEKRSAHHERRELRATQPPSGNRVPAGLRDTTGPGRGVVEVRHAGDGELRRGASSCCLHTPSLVDVVDPAWRTPSSFPSSSTWNRNITPISPPPPHRTSANPAGSTSQQQNTLPNLQHWPSSYAVIPPPPLPPSNPSCEASPGIPRTNASRSSRAIPPTSSSFLC